MSAEVMAIINQPRYLSPDGVDITRLVILHRRNHHDRHRTYSALVALARARRGLSDAKGKPNTTPDAADTTFHHTWRAADAKVEQQQDDARPYRGSRQQAQHRGNRRWNRS